MGKKVMEQTHNIQLDNGNGNTDAQLYVDEFGGIITWFGNGGEEQGYREVSLEEAEDILAGGGL